MSRKLIIMDAKFIATAFVDAINSRDRQALAQLMVTSCLADEPYTSPLPDYQIQVDRIITDCHTVVFIGQAIGAYGSVAAVWTAQLCGQKILDWHAYFDGQLSCGN